MVRGDILGALKSGLIRGETLKRAMMNLYNAGYKKNEIEEAAATLQQIIQQTPVAQAKPLQPIPQRLPQPIQKPVSQQQPIAKPQPKTIQRVSDYGQTSNKLQPNFETPKSNIQIKPLQPIQQSIQPNFEKPKSNIKIILIIFSLIILIGILVGSLLFSSELIEILNNAFN